MRIRAASTLGLLALVAALPSPLRADDRGLDLFATVAERDLIPEGIAFDPATRTLFLGSIRKRKIVALSAEGKARDFVTPEQDGLRSVLGLKVDSRHRALLACSGVDGPGMIHYSPADLGKSAVYEFDLATGRTRRIFRAPPGRHLFNDLVFTRDGILYVTDSLEGCVYRIDRDTGRVDRFTRAGKFVYPNGIAIDPGERTIFVADAQTIRAVDLGGGPRRELAHPPGVHLGEVDGLYFDNGALIAIQNGNPPVRIVRFSLSGSRHRVTGEMVLASGDPRFPEPTTGAIAGDVLYFVGDTQLRAIGKDGGLWPPEKLQPVRVYEMALRTAPPEGGFPRRKR